MSAISKVRQNIRQTRRQRARDIHATRSLFQRGTGDVNYLANEVGDYTNGVNNNINGLYDAAGGQISGANAALQGLMQQNTNQNADAASAELNRVGAGSVGLGNLRQDANFAQNAAAQQGTNDLVNNTQSKANAGAVGQLLLGMNQGQKQSALGQLLNARNDSITNIRNKYSDALLQSRQMINQIRAQQAQKRSYGGGYHSYGHSYGHGYSSGGSSNQYQSNQDAYIKLIGALNGGGGKPKPAPKPTNWVDDTMTFLGLRG
jgi:hypothetical protein